MPEMPGGYLPSTKWVTAEETRSIRGSFAIAKAALDDFIDAALQPEPKMGERQPIRYKPTLGDRQMANNRARQRQGHDQVTADYRPEAWTTPPDPTAILDDRVDAAAYTQTPYSPRVIKVRITRRDGTVEEFEPTQVRLKVGDAVTVSMEWEE